MTKVRLPVLPLLAATLLLRAAGPAAAQGRHHGCLAPTGDDDTAVLQAALDSCSGARRPCTVTLCAGTFRTGILRVRDFRGTLRGRGPERTVLRALPDLPVSANVPFFRDDPFGPDPWPYLVQFIEGRGRVEDLGILVPAALSGFPTTGWHVVDDGPIYELRGALLVTGRRPVDFEVRDVRIVAEDNPESELRTTTFHGLELGGLLHNPDDPGDFPVFPARGRLRVTDSTFDGVLTGTALAELAAADVLVARNRYRSSIAVDVIDVDRSGITVLGNRWATSIRGVQVRQNLDGAPSRASEVRVDGNRGTLAPFFAGFGEGLWYVDPADPASDPGGTALRVIGNRWTLGSAGGAVTSGITASGAARLRLAGNRLKGRVASGLEVDATSGCRIWGNSMHGLDTGAGPDLRLGHDTSDCLAVVGLLDVVVDEGVANRVIRR